MLLQAFPSPERTRMSAAGVRSLRRRYFLLLTLRFVPTGLFITVFVLLMRQRGLTLTDIGSPPRPRAS